MLIAMAVLYPICRKFYFSFTSLFGLLLGILMTGALIQLNGNLAGTGQDWWAITFACNFRALGEIAWAHSATKPADGSPRSPFPLASASYSPCCKLPDMGWPSSTPAAIPTAGSADRFCWCWLWPSP